MVERIEDEDKNPTIKLDRGLSIEEVNKLLTAPMPNRERAFFRAIYETFYRVNELLMCDIEDYNKETGELTARFTKNKYNPKSKKYIKSKPKHAIISKPSQLLFKKVIGNRKKGTIFINRNGERLSKTYLQMFINDLATSIGIQKVAKITEGGKYGKRKQNLVTIKALREAGERHMDLRGADRDVTARASQHSALVKERHYKKSGWEEFQEQQRKFHPAFQEGLK